MMTMACTRWHVSTAHSSLTEKRWTEVYDSLGVSDSSRVNATLFPPAPRPRRGPGFCASSSSRLGRDNNRWGNVTMRSGTRSVRLGSNKNTAHS
jgi:hypothetical protein